MFYCGMEILKDWKKWGGEPEQFTDGSVHVWRIGLNEQLSLAAHLKVLSADEGARADRFHHSRDRNRFVTTHGAVRGILAMYLHMPPMAITFENLAAGKPVLSGAAARHNVQFNLSHSGNCAVLVVGCGREVGVDLEEWDPAIEALQLADHFFSPAESRVLHSLQHEHSAVIEGFFNAWSRKEAYLKATAVGITAGLHHFDVSLTPGDHATLIADRRDETAIERWRMFALDVRPNYSAALVAANPVARVELYDYWNLEAQ